MTYAILWLATSFIAGPIVGGFIAAGRG